MGYRIIAIYQSKELLTSLEQAFSVAHDDFVFHGFCCDTGIVNLVQDHRPDLVLLDANAYGGNIVESIVSFKQIQQTQSVPIIAIVDFSQNHTIQSLFHSGVDDFLSFPFSPKELTGRIVVNIQRARLLEKLRQQSEQFSDISLAASRAGSSLIIIDKDGYISWVNEGFERLYECNLDEFNEKFGKNIFNSTFNSHTADAMKRCRENGEYVTYDSVWITKDNERKNIQTSLTPIYDALGQFSKIIAIETDITDLKMAEEALADKHDNLLSTMEHLEQANSMLDDQRREIEQQKGSLEEEKAKTDALLLNILPFEVARQLTKKGVATPKKFKEVSVLFADFVGFSNVSVAFEDINEFIRVLGFYFESFDEITSARFIEKIKTIGDCYMCVGGVPRQNHSHAFDTVLAALEIQRFVEDIAKTDQHDGRPVWRLRIGIHTGSVVAGVIGKKKFAYDVWGDTVNVASRMETAGEAGKVNISETTYQYVKDYFLCTYRGKVPAKNIGEINMYFVERILPKFSEDDRGVTPNAEFRKVLASY